MKYLKVGEIARTTGKTVRAIRYYEELGLVEPVSHTKGGFRLFKPDVIEKLALIDKFQVLSLTLEEVANVVQAYRESQTGEDAARKLKPLLEQTLKKIQDRMVTLDLLRREVAGALQFVNDCVGCKEHAEPQRCTICDKGEHEQTLPNMIDSLVK